MRNDRLYEGGKDIEYQIEENRASNTDRDTTRNEDEDIVNKEYQLYLEKRMLKEQQNKAKAQRQAKETLPKLKNTPMK